MTLANCDTPTTEWDEHGDSYSRKSLIQWRPPILPQPYVSEYPQGKRDTDWKCIQSMSSIVTPSTRCQSKNEITSFGCAPLSPSQPKANQPSSLMNSRIFLKYWKQKKKKNIWALKAIRLIATFILSLHVLFHPMAWYASDQGSVKFIRNRVGDSIAGIAATAVYCCWCYLEDHENEYTSAASRSQRLWSEDFQLLSVTRVKLCDGTSCM